MILMRGEKREENGEGMAERNAMITPCRAASGLAEGVETRRRVHFGTHNTPQASRTESHVKT